MGEPFYQFRDHRDQLKYMRKTEKKNVVKSQDDAEVGWHFCFSLLIFTAASKIIMSSIFLKFKLLKISIRFVKY